MSICGRGGQVDFQATRISWRICLDVKRRLGVRHERVDDVAEVRDARG